MTYVIRLTLILMCISLNVANSSEFRHSVLFRLFMASSKSPLENKTIALRTFNPQKDKIEDLQPLLDESEISTDFKSKWWKNSLEGCAGFFQRGAFEGDGATGGTAIRLPLLIEDKKTGKIIGNFNMNEYPGFIEISYNIFPAYRRQGFALEAINVGTKAVQHVDSTIQIGAWTEPQNTASRNLLEKAGLIYQFTDHRPLCAYFLK